MRRIVYADDNFILILSKSPRVRAVLPQPSRCKEGRQYSSVLVRCAAVRTDTLNSTLNTLTPHDPQGVADGERTWNPPWAVQSWILFIKQCLLLADPSIHPSPFIPTTPKEQRYHHYYCLLYLLTNSGKYYNNSVVGRGCCPNAAINMHSTHTRAGRSHTTYSSSSSGHKGVPSTIRSW